MENNYSPFEDYLGFSKLLHHGDTDGKDAAAAKSWSTEMIDLGLTINGQPNEFWSGHQDDLMDMEFRGTSSTYEDDHVSDVTTTTSGDNDVYTTNSSRRSSKSEYYYMGNTGRQRLQSRESMTRNISTRSTTSECFYMDNIERQSREPMTYTCPSGVDKLAKMMEMNYQLTSMDDNSSGCFLEFRPTPCEPKVKVVKHCVLCKRNGESKDFYTTHVLKDSCDKVVCPILRKYECPRCQATGDHAHTLRHCPFAEHVLG